MSFEKNPNPTKDQHFMVDKNMLQLIYDTANIQEGESIVEIGGKGRSQPWERPLHVKISPI